MFHCVVIICDIGRQIVVFFQFIHLQSIPNPGGNGSPGTVGRLEVKFCEFRDVYGCLLQQCHYVCFFFCFLSCIIVFVQDVYPVYSKKYCLILFDVMKFTFAEYMFICVPGFCGSLLAMRGLDQAIC